MIPADQLNPNAAIALGRYLDFEIFQALGQRRVLEDRWIKWLRMYRGMPEFSVKEFPFLGASNLVVPLIATDVDTVAARIMGILFATENLWGAEPLNDEMVEFAARLQEFLQWAQHHELNTYNAVADWIIEICLLGTGVLKERYRREMKEVFQFRETEGGVVQSQQTILLHDHPEQSHVSLFDFLVPATATDIESAPWCAERIGLSWGQLQERARAGVYTNIDQIARYNQRGTDSSPVLAAMQVNDNFQPNIADRFELWECWLDFDIRGNGRPVAIVATWHVPSRTMLRIDYNPFFNQEKPYSYARFMRQPKRFYGIGLAEMNEHFQDGATAMHNQRIDNATLANSTMMKGRKGIGIKEDEPIFPGRWFLVDNMDDVEPMNIGQRFDSTIQNEEVMLGYASKRTGVNDYVTGSFSPAMGYSTATVGVQNLTESNKRFDQVMREIRQALKGSGTRIVELYQQYNLHGKEYLAMGQKDGAKVQQVLQFPIEMIRASVGIDLTATSAAANKEVAVRTNSIIMQSLTQFYGQGIQAMSMALNPQVPMPIRQMAFQMVQSQNILLRRMLDSYGVQDADDLLPELQRGQDVSATGQYGGQGGSQGFAPASGLGAPPNGGAGVAGYLPQPTGIGI